MNPNNPAPDPSAEMNDAILQRLQTYRWKSRTLTGLALGVGLLSILAGIVLAWANVMMVMPMERLLLQDYPGVLGGGNTNSVPPERRSSKSDGWRLGIGEGDTNSAVRPRPSLSRDQLDWRHVQVTAVHGKALFLTAASIALLGVGTFLTLLLVIFNRRVTLRQINASLAQISNQIKEMRQSKAPGDQP